MNYCFIDHFFIFNTMEEQQILDNELKEVNVSKGVLRWQWHFKHAGIIIGLYLLIVFCLECIIPYLPKVLGDLLGFAIRFLIIFGTCFITGYVCRVGYKWSWIASFIGGGSLFLVVFILTMNNLDYWVNLFATRLQVWTSLSRDWLESILEVLVVGIIYSFYIVILIEIMILVSSLLAMLYRLIKKD